MTSFLSDHLERLVDRLEHRHHFGGPDVRPTSTGIGLIDEAGGVGPGGWLVRGAPGAGTTAVALTFLARLAVEEPRTIVHVLTAALAPEEVAARLLALVGGLSVERLQREVLEEPDWQRVGLGLKALESSDVRITDARRWSHAELEMWCVDERPALTESQSWMVVDGADRLVAPGVLSLPHLEHVSGRSVLVTTRDVLQHESAAALVTTVHAHVTGHRSITIDRSPTAPPPRRRARLSIDAASLRVREIDGPEPGPGQLQLDVTGDQLDAHGDS